MRRPERREAFKHGRWPQPLIDMGNADKKHPAHLDIAVWWWNHGCKDTAAAKRFGKHRQTIAKYREEEDWQGYFNSRADALIDDDLINRVYREAIFKALEKAAAYFGNDKLKIARAQEATQILKLLQDELGGASNAEKVDRIIIEHRPYGEKRAEDAEVVEDG